MSSIDASSTVAAGRSETWKWYICIVLLLATVVNYLDRLTINNLAIDIQDWFQDPAHKEQLYGYLELGFGVAFGVGSLFFGYLVDRLGVYWLYPIVLVGWSMAGLLTGFSQTYGEMLGLRIMLGFFEAGHFPCGLKTVQLLMTPRDRAMGNSLLQSGTAVGAVLSPQAIKLLREPGADGWRQPFKVIGVAGCLWVIAWLASIRPRDLRASRQSRLSNRALNSRSSDSPNADESRPSDLEASEQTRAAGVQAETPPAEAASFFQVFMTRRFLALVIVVICINLNWHFFRVWLPKFLRQARGYEENAALDFTSWYYAAADLGILSAGVASSWLVRHGRSIFASRMITFAACALLTTSTTLVAVLPAGQALLCALTVVAFGALGCFAAYYSLAQDLTRAHQGKVTGSLAMCTWLTTAAFHPVFGKLLDSAPSLEERVFHYNVIAGVMGWLPMIALAAVLVLWRSPPAEVSDVAPELPPEPAEALGR